jgi:hypothetical protein
MAISAVSANSSAQAPTDADRALAVLKKERDVEKLTADALIELVKQAGPSQVGGRINTYA